MIRKFLPSDNVDERLVCRDGHFSVFDGRLLDAGGFLVDSQWAGLKSFDEIVKTGNAIIVAEGGMGKSHVQRLFCESRQDQSCVKRIELVSYAHNEQGLTDAIMEAARNREYLFLDGLDEAENLAGALARILAEIDGHAHIVLASRGISKLGALSERLRWPMFSLLPYSRENVRELCKESDVDADAFMRTIDGQNLGGFCSRPLGCMMLIEKYKKTSLKGATSESLWYNLIEKLCDENQESITRDFVRCEKVIPVHEGIRIATIVALSLKLSGRTLISRIENRLPKVGAFDFSRLFADKDTQETFNALLLRSLFLYVDKGCYRFAHSTYVDFLAAQGVMEYLDEKEWEHLVFSPEGLPYPQWECVVPWLAARNDTILEKIRQTRPDLLLLTDALVNRLGEDEICQAILEHADHIPSSVRNNPAVQSRYYALNTSQCAKVIQRVLKSEASEVIVDTALDIVRRARLAKVSDVLVDMFCNENRESSTRIKAGCALIELANKSQRRKCKKVLQEPMAHRLKAIVARMTWPDLMSVEELIPLIENRPGNEIDSLSSWLEYGGFVASLSRLAGKDKIRLLEWAVSGIQKRDDRLDGVADARKAVFLHCWKEAWSKKTVPLLAKGIAAYAAIFQSPFASSSDDWLDSSHIYSHQEFCNDVERRRGVAKFVVEHPPLPLDACWMYLLGVGDGDFVVSELNKAVDYQIRARWASCLSWIGYMVLPEKAGLWDKLHREFPEIYTCNASDALSKAQKREKEIAAMRHGHAQSIANQKAKNKLVLSKNLVWAHQILQSGRAKGQFVSLMRVIDQQRDREESASFLDFRTSALWSSLSEIEMRNLVKAGYDFLLNCDGPWSDDQRGYPIYTQTLCLLFGCGRDLLERMPIRVWRKVAPEMFHYFGFDTFEWIPATIGCFKKLHGRTFFDVFSKQCRAHLHSKVYWTIKELRPFLSGKEILRLLSLLDEDGLADELKNALYDKFDELDHELTGQYLEGKYTSLPLRNLGPHTIAWILLASPWRFAELLKELDSDAQWGKWWAEKVLSQEEHRRGKISRILPQLSAMEIKEFYLWLNIQFPPEKEPHHIGAYTPDAMDNLYQFKSSVFNALRERMTPEAVTAIEELHRHFPAGNWFHDCALQLRTQLLATKCPTFSLEGICKLLENKKRMQVIHSTDDLLQVVMASLGRYQTYLTGVNNPQVRFLWPKHKGNMSHISEEDFSDHIQAFFSADFQKIVSNREVRLNCGRKGQTGARTDILINASADEMAMPLSLCIEVKGSWNREVKTAYKTQLVDKYMDDGGADAGIFLVGWFESEQEEKKTCIDKKENIEKMLEVQEQELVGQGHKVKHLIVDCSYSLPPRPAKKRRNAKRKKE